ncbi:hypothetical protein BGZ50_001256, partial [Haplosporangium sp. Z 11]
DVPARKKFTFAYTIHSTIHPMHPSILPSPMESFQQQRKKPIKDAEEAASREEDSDNESINMETEEAELESRLSTTEAMQDTIVLMKEAKDCKIIMSIAHAAQIKAYAQQRNSDLSPTELKKLDKGGDAKNRSYRRHKRYLNREEEEEEPLIRRRYKRPLGEEEPLNR